MTKESLNTNDLLAKMKAIEARALERSRQRREQESLPFPPEVEAESKPPAQVVTLSRTRRTSA